VETAEEAMETGVSIPVNQEQVQSHDHVHDHKHHNHNHKHTPKQHDEYNSLIKNGKDEVSISMIEMSKVENKPLADISIYRHRHCRTCKIMLPPKSSHCSACDNCVKGFDHHCYFVGNCIGRRNHKFFFLFLFYASIYLLFSTTIAVQAIIEAFDKDPKLTGNLGNQYQYFIASVFLILFGWICCRPRMCEGMKTSMIALGALLGLLGFYMACRHTPLRYYENPATLVAFIVALSPLSIWVYMNTLGTLFVISLGLTVKEQAVIEREVGCCGTPHLKLTLKERLDHIIIFFTRPNIESQIHGVN